MCWPYAGGYTAQAIGLEYTTASREAFTGTFTVLAVPILVRPPSKYMLVYLPQYSLPPPGLLGDPLLAVLWKIRISCFSAL